MLAELEQDYRRWSKSRGGIARYIYGILFNAGFRAIALYRIGHWFFKRKWRHSARFIERMSFHTCNCEIYVGADIAPGLRIAHTVGLVIGEGTHIGSNCDVRQNVTLGGNFHLQDENGRTQPWLNDNISIGAGAVIIGPVKIGSNSIIGANSVVTKDVPENVIVLGAPARVIKNLGAEADPTNRYV